MHVISEEISSFWVWLGAAQKTKLTQKHQCENARQWWGCIFQPWKHNQGLSGAWVLCLPTTRVLICCNGTQIYLSAWQTSVPFIGIMVSDRKGTCDRNTLLLGVWGGLFSQLSQGPEGFALSLVPLYCNSVSVCLLQRVEKSGLNSPFMQHICLAGFPDIYFLGGFPLYFHFISHMQ